MKRPDLDTLACVNAECQLFRHTGANNLVIRKGYDHDRIRLLRCRTWGEECSERRGTALCNTQLPEGTAEDVLSSLDEGCSVRATARLVTVDKETVARLVRVAGRHAQRFHNQPVLVQDIRVQNPFKRIDLSRVPLCLWREYPQRPCNIAACLGLILLTEMVCGIEHGSLQERVENPRSPLQKSGLRYPCIFLAYMPFICIEYGRRLTKNGQANIDHETRIRVFRPSVVFGETVVALPGLS